MLYKCVSVSLKKIKQNFSLKKIENILFILKKKGKSKSKISQQLTIK